MAFDYSPVLLVANNLIAEFGRSITLNQIDKTAADPTKPWKGSNGTRVKLADTMGVFAAVSSLRKLGEGWIDDELLKTATMLCLVGGQELPFELADVIQDGTQEWKVEWAEVLQPGTPKLLFAFSVTR